MNIKPLIKTTLCETIAFIVGFHLLVVPAALFIRSVYTEAEREAPEVADYLIANVVLLLQDEQTDSGTPDAGQP